MGRWRRGIAESFARPQWQGDSAGRVRGLLQRVLVRASGRLPAGRGIHDSAVPDVRIYNVLFGALCSVIAVTAFRRGERWAWWTLLVGNTVALVSAMTYDKTVHAIGPFELTEYLGLVMVWGALAVTAPFRAAGPPVRATV